MPHRRARLHFLAHTVGLPEHLDSLPGTQDHDESSARKYAKKETCDAGAVHVSFRNDEKLEPLQRLLLNSVRGIRISYGRFRRLWLPRNSITEKCPFHRDAFAHPEKAVMLDGSTQRMLAAKRTGHSNSMNLSYRPKPKFITGEPGIKTILAFNLAFIYWLMYGSF